MDSIIKEKWVVALRSGTYEQGYGKLRSLDNKFCCLGVLCDVVDPESWKPREIKYAHRGSRSGYPINDIMSSAGLDKETGWKLVDQNDKGVPFIEIADWVERNL